METLPRCIIGERNSNDIKYADDTAVVVDTERKLQRLLEKVLKENVETNRIKHPLQQKENPKRGFTNWRYQF